MEYQNKCLDLLSILLLLLQICFVAKIEALTNNTVTSKNVKKVSAFYVFGDSTVDSGNNNYIPTPFRCNFLPYGRDFAGSQPTGRYTNGRLATDFLASYLGLKDNIPPYLDPTLTTQDLLTGVTFASGGSGYDPFTPLITNVVPMTKQLEYFKEYKKRIESEIGKKETEEHIKKALFLVSAGTNDFVINYFLLPTRRKRFNDLSYEQFVIQHAKQFLQGLWDEGARKILVVGLPPMGCLPMVITLLSHKSPDQRSCIDKYTNIASNYNTILQNELSSMQHRLSSFGTRISYVDIYGPPLDLIQGRTNYEFEDVYSGCCGSGYVEASILCNPLSYTCEDASKYIYWDSIHPTESTYYYVYKTVLCPLIDRLFHP